MAVEIVLAGIKLTQAEWEALDPESRALLLEAMSVSRVEDLVVPELLPFKARKGRRRRKSQKLHVAG